MDREGANGINRRDFLKAAGAAGLTVNLFTGSVKGANDRIAMGFIGTGAQGMGNLRNALAARDLVRVTTVCDVYQPALERAVALVKTIDPSGPKATRDFRQVLADRSIDAVCITTPDHWHAIMTVEACKAGKDVYVEKPAFVYLDEGPKMVEAARKYNRVVQGGTMQRSMPTFLKAKEIVDRGILGRITWCKTWATSVANRDGYGNPPDSEPPADLDWDMWLGPARKVPFNENRWGVPKATWPTFRYFWDYAGGAMTDWGVHFVDPIHQFLGEPMPTAISAIGGRTWVKDNLETADTMSATFEYPDFMMTYELRQSSADKPYGLGGGSAIMGTEGMVTVTRQGCWFTPNDASTSRPIAMVLPRTTPAVPPRKGAPLPPGPPSPPSIGKVPKEPSVHWQNFFDCVRSRQKPTSDIENLVKSSAVCILANVSMRAKTRLDFDPKTFKVAQPAASTFTGIDYRAPWKLEV
jgi:predicted dehydrogenase